MKGARVCRRSFRSDKDEIVQTTGSGERRSESGELARRKAGKRESSAAETEKKDARRTASKKQQSRQQPKARRRSNMHQANMDMRLLEKKREQKKLVNVPVLYSNPSASTEVLGPEMRQSENRFC